MSRKFGLTMITEDYVDFETAKLLKEKGFNEKTYRCYNLCTEEHELSDIDDIALNNWELNNDGVSAPTIQMVMKWLRDKFKLEIYPFHEALQENNNWWFRIERFSKGFSSTEFESDCVFPSYEEATEAGIKHCLENLI